MDAEKGRERRERENDWVEFSSKKTNAVSLYAADFLENWFVLGGVVLGP